MNWEVAEKVAADMEPHLEKYANEIRAEVRVPVREKLDELLALMDERTRRLELLGEKHTNTDALTKAEKARLMGKAEGVRLAKGYLLDTMQDLELRGLV